MRILVFGDSIAKGYYDTEGSGWVERLSREHLMYAATHPDKNWHAVYNLSIAGNTSVELDGRIAGEIEARRWQDDPMAVVIAIGINDSRLQKGKPVSTTQEYYRTLDWACKKATIETDRILLVGLACVDESRTKPVPYNPDVSYINERLQQFENTIAQVAKNRSLAFVPVFEKMKAEQENRQLFHDGVHPNTDGHAFIADIVRPEFAKLVS